MPYCVENAGKSTTKFAAIEHVGLIGDRLKVNVGYPFTDANIESDEHHEIGYITPK